MTTRTLVLAVCLLVSSLAGAAPENPVTNGGFERLSNGFPVGWSRVCRAAQNRVEVTDEARNGKHALRLLRVVDEGEVGFNRGWAPSAGGQGAMLAERKGGLVFHYKALSATGARLLLYAIPMSADPLENTGASRAAYEIPKAHVGDGHWHRASLPYDFTDNDEVKWVHVSGRILGGQAELLIDDVEYVAQVGAVPKIVRAELTESPTGNGPLVLTARLENGGDAAGNFQIGVTVPRGLTLTRNSAIAFTGVGVGDRRDLSVEIGGNRDTRGALTLTVRSGQEVAEQSFTLAPQLKTKALRPDLLVLPRFASTGLQCEVENTGHANLRDVTVALSMESPLVVEGNAALQKKVSLIRPGQTAAVRWSVKAVAEALAAGVQATVTAPGASAQTVTDELVITTDLPEEIGWPAPGGKAAVTAAQRGVVLENQHVRAEFPLSRAGYGACNLFVKSGGKWQQAGVLQRLADVRHVTRRGQLQRLLFAGQATLEHKPEAPGVSFRAFVRDADDVLWTVQQQWSVRPGAKVFDVYTHCYVPRPRKLVSFETLALQAGAGGFGDAKTDALFPGLEWLEGDEPSSNALDFAPDHPDRIRQVPHVNKITVPLMSVHHDRTTVGLLWEATEKWDGTHQAPGAVFCSPNYLEGRTGHLMGLILPTCPQWLEENTRRAPRPYDLTPKGALRLTAQVYLDGDSDGALSAVDQWFALHGVPEPLPPPRGNWTKEIEFSLAAYLDSLWDPEANGWYSTRGGPKLMEKVAAHGSYVYDLLQAQKLITDPALQRRLRQRLDEAQMLGGGRPATDDYGITYGDPFRALDAAARQVTLLLNSQRPDGSWRFNAKAKRTGVFAGRDYSLLGPDDAAELGTCARNAYTLLRFARTTGEAQALSAGEKALAFMQRFRVPRAAQVWEVPVHAPDLLAAADACEAYLAGYECTRNAGYRIAAGHWARAGLPFVYVWNAPEFPFMRYASIPVFGATWFRGSWIGRAVQWNGLRYAYAIQRLADYDDSFPWRRVAEGLIVSAMYQQSTDAQDLALWPDNISTLDAHKSRWLFGPRRLFRNLNRFLGRDEEPWTQLVEVGGGAIRLTSRCRLSRLSVGESTVAVTATLPAGDSGWMLVAGLERPTAVMLNGLPLPLLRGDALPTEAGYGYEPAHGLLKIWLPNDKPANLLLTGVAPRKLSYVPPTLTEIDFSFDDGDQGWLAAHDVDGLTATGGKLTGRITGGDPYLVRPALKVVGRDTDVLVAKLTVTAGDGGQFFWTTTDSPLFAPDKSVTFALTPGPTSQTIQAAVGSHPLWRGKTITALRIDCGAGAATGRFEIDWLRRATTATR